MLASSTLAMAGTAHPSLDCLGQDGKQEDESDDFSGCSSDDESMPCAVGDDYSSEALTSAPLPPSQFGPTGGSEPDAAEPVVLSSQEDANPEDGPSMSEAVAGQGDIFTDPITETETEVKEVVAEKSDIPSASSLPETGETSNRILKPDKAHVFGEPEPTDRLKKLQKMLSDAKKLRTAKMLSGLWIFFSPCSALLGSFFFWFLSTPNRDCKIQGKLSNPSLECHPQLQWHRRRWWKSLIRCLLGMTQLRPRLLLIFAMLHSSGSTLSSRPVQIQMIALKML